MGLMKTLSQSSKELKAILDRLTALESGDTFVTKEMFDSLNQTVTTINTDVTNIKNGDSFVTNEQLSNKLENINPFFTAAIPASSTIEVALPAFVTIFSGI